MTTHICPDRPGVNPLRLALAALPAARTVPQWPERPRGHVIPAYQARTGLVALCRHWGIGSGHEVLVPAYNCGCELDTLRHLGADVRLYRVDEHARIDLDDLCARVTERTRMVYVIHYFGWPQDLRELLPWCRSRGIRLVEDCALSLFSRDGETPLGSGGDAALFSLPKTLPVPDGGALVMPDAGSGLALPSRSPAMLRIGRKAASLGKIWLLGRVRPVPSLKEDDERPSDPGLENEDEQYSAGLPDMPAYYYHDAATSEWTISRFTAALLRQMDPRQIVERRRRNYLQLDLSLREVEGVRPLYNRLPEGVCPLVYPLVVTNRHRWVAALRQRGIGAIPWWEGHHQGFTWKPFPESHHLKMHVLALPVHQDLAEEQIDYIAARVISLAKARPTLVGSSSLG